MELKVLASGSSGNCYILRDGPHALLLDAGIQYSRILKGLSFQLEGVLGVLITHEHNDHSAAVSGLLRAGIRCCMSKGTREALGIPPAPPIMEIVEYQKLSLGSFLILPFPAKHDAAEPMGFLILNKATGERLVYATDTYYLPHTFPGIHYWLIECNYVDSLITEDTPFYMKSRLLKSHMSLDRLCGVFKANDLTRCQQIVLCHISGQRGDSEIMAEAITQISRKPVTTAIPGATIPLNLQPF